MNTQPVLCSAWIARGLSHREWFHPANACVQLLGPEALGPVLVWLRAAWGRQRYRSCMIASHELNKATLGMLLNMSSLDAADVILISVDPAHRIAGTDVVKLVEGHTGPPFVVFVTPPNYVLAIERSQRIEFPEIVDAQTWQQVATLAYDFDGENNSRIAAMIRCLQSSGHKVTWSAVSSLTPYLSLLGRGSSHFMRSWLPRIVQGKPSLFSLAQHLFAKDGGNFYHVWYKVYEQYSDEFWLVYWSDQLWKAYVFIVTAQQRGNEAAAHSAKGLPFSFMRHSWRLYSAEFLGDCIEIVYAYDQHVKRGGIRVPFELLFHKILTSQYCSQQG